MKGLPIVFLLALVGCGRGYESVWSGEWEEPLATTCQIGDLQCGEDCESIELCVENSQTITVENCTSTTLCDSTTFTCEDEADVQCVSPPDETTFTCHGTGFFPSPYDCHFYFYCTANTVPGEIRSCANDSALEYGYDPLTTLCLYTEQDRVCVEKPIPRCVTAGTTGAQKENPNIYYVCVHDADSGTVIPWLFRCTKSNEIYDEVDKKCVPRSSVTTVTTPTDSTVTLTDSTTTPTDSTTTPTDSTTTPTDGTTTPTDSTTTPTDGTTTPTDVTTTPTDSTTTPTVTSTETTIDTSTLVTTTAKYNCVKEGSFPDLEDCRSFYLCTANLDLIHFTCQTGYYFDKTLLYCVRGNCT